MGFLHDNSETKLVCKCGVWMQKKQVCNPCVLLVSLLLLLRSRPRVALAHTHTDRHDVRLATTLAQLFRLLTHTWIFTSGMSASCGRIELVFLNATLFLNSIVRIYMRSSNNVWQVILYLQNAILNL